MRRIDSRQNSVHWVAEDHLFNLQLMVEGLKPNHLTSGILTLIKSSTYTGIKGNLEKRAWEELTGYTLNTPCF